MLQGTIRHVPGRTYHTAVRLGFNTPDAFRMAVKRGLSVGLDQIDEVTISPLLNRLLGTVIQR